MTIIDITPSVSARMPVWPGDTPFHAKRTWAISKQSPVNVSQLIMSTHTGAHADAPLHYHSEGAPIDQVDVSAYIGPCLVAHLTAEKHIISADTLARAVRRIADEIPERVLIRTYEKQPAEWDPGFVAIAPDAIHWLADKGVRLIGVDTPSLDPASSKLMDAHMAVNRRNLRILEGLLLDGVNPGCYELIAPPLKLEGLDAAPVRALLRTLS